MFQTLLLASLVGCGAPVVKPPAATLLVRCNDEAAMVYVDDTLVGKVADLSRAPVGLRVGFHRVELRALGKLSAYREVTLRPADRVTLEVTLRPDLDAE